jgi:hypothetical protein
MISLTPAQLAWIDALAEQDAADYLREEVAQRLASEAERTERVPLPDLDKAA